MNAFALEAEGISKFFPGVKALDNVSLRVRPGTVHALMGENGAGKSTLMKCLIGIYRPDKGSIRVKGEPVEFTDTMDALRSGISMIHQELNLVPHMTVAENIWLGREPMKYGFVDHGQLTRQTQALLDKLITTLAGSLNRSFVLEKFCEQEQCSERALRQQFRTQTGMTVNHYLRQLRICHAQYLLQHTELMVSEVAMRCGFEDSNYFSVVFNREVGMTPVQWRHRSRKAA